VKGAKGATGTQIKKERAARRKDGKPRGDEEELYLPHPQGEKRS